MEILTREVNSIDSTLEAILGLEIVYFIQWFDILICIDASNNYCHYVVLISFNSTLLFSINYCIYNGHEYSFVINNVHHMFAM